MKALWILSAFLSVGCSAILKSGTAGNNGKPSNDGEGIDGYLQNIQTIKIAESDGGVVISGPAGTIGVRSGAVESVELGVWSITTEEIQRYYLDDTLTTVTGTRVASGNPLADASFTISFAGDKPEIALLSAGGTDGNQIEIALSGEEPNAALLDSRSFQEFVAFAVGSAGHDWTAVKSVTIKTMDGKKSCRLEVGDKLIGGQPPDYYDGSSPMNPTGPMEFRFVNMPAHCGFAADGPVGTFDRGYSIAIPDFEEAWFTYESMVPYSYFDWIAKRAVTVTEAASKKQCTLDEGDVLEGSERVFVENDSMWSPSHAELTVGFTKAPEHCGFPRDEESGTYRVVINVKDRDAFEFDETNKKVKQERIP